MIGYIYLTINDVNSICYIGKRQKPSFEKAYKGSGTHLKLAFKKYGKELFHTYILEWCETRERLCEAEKKWIALFKEFGAELYNIGKGGDGGNMIDWRAIPKDKRHEINHKNSLAHLGELNPFYGRHHTQQTIEKIREKNKKNEYPAELKAYKDNQRAKLPKVLQIDKTTGEAIKIWDNWCEASKEVSKKNRCGYGHIAECCRHKRKSAYGFKWEFAEMGWKI